MRRLNFGRIAAAAALLVGSAAGVAPRTIANVQASVQPNSNKDQATPIPASVQAPAVIEIKTRGYGYTVKHPIWIGIQKRGNRRLRSRFNYNR